MSVAGMQHAEVVAAIKAGGEQTSMLVVDPEADAYFTSCNVLPTEEHLRGRSARRRTHVQTYRHTDTHTHAHTHARTYRRTHAQTHACTDARTHARTDARTYVHMHRRRQM